MLTSRLALRAPQLFALSSLLLVTALTPPIGYAPAAKLPSSGIVRMGVVAPTIATPFRYHW